MPGNGRKSPCEEDELRERLEQDGAVYNSSDLPPALSVLENNDGSIPGLPYVLSRCRSSASPDGDGAAAVRRGSFARYSSRYSETSSNNGEAVDAARHHRHGDVEGLNQAERCSRSTSRTPRF